jgi:group II intron reverse transcriptase/maturase
MSNAINPEVNRSEYKTEIQQWHRIDWAKVERKVFKLQKRIYKAERVGDTRTVRKLQNTLTHSWYAKLLAVKKVTQNNRGKNTAGIDEIKFLKNEQKLKLAEKLTFSNKAKPVQRIWISKPEKTEKRTLGIPTIEDRAKQALLKLALEPQWEARFEPHSYGCRSVRSCHDAIKAIYNSLTTTEKWVLDADIAGCFDNINHQQLLDKVDTTPTFRKQIKAWLKAGVIDWTNPPEVYQKTTQATPQSSVISPLLANIALYGLENHVKDWLWDEKKYRISVWNATKQQWETAKQSQTKATLSIIRYADDFVIIHENLEILKEAKVIAEEFLKSIGLHIKDEKTHIVSSKEGFDFLGVNIRHFETGLYRSDKNLKGEKTGLIGLIQPSKEAILKQYRKVAETLDSLKNASVDAVINKLNPIIRGFSNYYRYYNSTERMNGLDNLIFEKLLRWAKRRHPNKGMKWVANKYFLAHSNQQKWQFSNDNLILRNHTNTKIERYIQVKGRVSIPKCYEGKDRYDNLQILHARCHKPKSRQDKVKPNESEPQGIVS